MEWFKERFLDSFIIFLNMILTILILKSCINIEGIDYYLITLLFIIGLIIAWVYDEKVKSLEKKLVLTMIILSAMLLMVIVFRKYAVSFIIEGIGNNMTHITSNMRERLPSSFSLIRNLFVITIPTLTPFAMWIKKRGFSDIIILINMVLMMVYWYLGYYEEIDKVMYIFIILSIITYAVNNLGNYSKRLKRKEIRNNIVTSKIIWSTILLSIVSSMFIVLLPKSASGKFSKIITDKVVENIADDSGGDYNPDKYGYSLAKSGYNDSSKILGGPINIDDREAFKLEYKGNVKNEIYLKGSAKDKYTGMSWVPNYRLIEKNNMMDSAYLGNFVGANEETMTIHPDYITTTTLFNPYYSKVVNIKYNSDNKTYVDKVNGAFYSEKPIKTEYTINFYSNSTYDKDFDKPLSGSNYVEIDQLLNNGDLSNYLQLPDTITQRTVDLVYDIVKGTSSNDEKAYRLKAYLTKNYTYSLDVSSVPEGKDFVDYFLFEEKKGYCVYFATAMTVMCRIAGIPARYVEGFKVSKDKENNGMYKVTNEDAHAWTEIYLAFNGSNYNVARALPFTKIDTVPTAYQYRHAKEVQNNGGSDGVGLDGSKSALDSNKNGNTKKVDLEKADSEDKNKTYYLYFKVLSPIALILIYIITRICLVVIKRRKIIKSNSLIPLYDYCKLRVNRINIIKSKNETDLEFAENIPNYEISKKMVELVGLIYREFYAEEDNLHYDRIQMINYIESTIRSNQGKTKYLIKRYILF
ncbi:transglutaminase domain-containing protein [Clostridium sp. YIM B02505]|uniref:Transglutaminase domain-containing protein n=1 Tax=Clostridium yunnanense TaxID=2800325 RepID=A0ABS1EUN7_9CLOT|nr:transglutaminase domain-containing protein [Clostridium yunnanense]MBK1813102.1 transglutaminase domain-containing protein [Clostridium yunnanense]